MAERSLADIPAGLVWQAQQAALMRLQLYLVGRTHEALRAVLDGCRSALARARGQAEGWDGLSTHLAVEGVSAAWRRGFAGWRRLFEGLRWCAAAIPFGSLAVLHEAAFASVRQAEARGGLREAAGGPSPVFEPQLRQVVDGAAERVWGDGFRLSQRIWRLDQESLERIRQTVYRGVAEGRSAWQVAQELEAVLGAGADCPRWTRTRLYRLTKADIASGDRTGLYSGEACAGQGVAYNALRLARNEIQVAHHMATDAVMARMPWVEQEQVMLSPAHPEEDVCDDVISRGARGEGVYPRGTIQLPLHPQCLCYKVAVLLPPDEFAGRLRGWVQGTERWPEMDAYAGWLGTGPQGLPQVALGQVFGRELLTWLWGDEAAMDAAAARWALPDEQLALGF